ncbi:MAG: HD domain-containing protein [Pseudoxanthomonas sp.]
MKTVSPTARVIDAAAFAAHAHRNQRRKDADQTPYINHPLALLRILAVEAGVLDEDVLCAAALHDYLEDCCGDESQPSVAEGCGIVRNRFGDTVLEYVVAVTDDKTLPKAERKQKQIERAAEALEGAKLVKLADKISNLRDIVATPPADWSLERRQQYFDWAGAVIGQVRGVHAGLEALFDAEYAKRST